MILLLPLTAFLDLQQSTLCSINVLTFTDGFFFHIIFHPFIFCFFVSEVNLVWMAYGWVQSVYLHTLEGLFAPFTFHVVAVPVYTPSPVSLSGFSSDQTNTGQTDP